MRPLLFGEPARMRAFAPGRVNLIGDHTDYAGGLVLPMAIDLGTTVAFEPGGDRVELTSDDEPEPARLPLDVGDPSAVAGWSRYVAGVIAAVRPTVGGTGRVSTTLPIGAGLSSSSALMVSVALALGFVGNAVDLALVCQRAEAEASRVPGGVMDQLTSACGVEGHALLIDCSTLDITPIRMPPDAEIVVVHSGQPRALVGSEYATRRSELEAGHPMRMRHVASENQRVVDCADALRAGDLSRAGRLMVESHTSLRDDYEVSTPALDGLVERLIETPGVHGARLTGAGFGGCVVALTDPDALTEGWHVRASRGAHLQAVEEL